MANDIPLFKSLYVGTPKLAFTKLVWMVGNEVILALSIGTIVEVVEPEINFWLLNLIFHNNSYSPYPS